MAQTLERTNNRHALHDSLVQFYNARAASYDQEPEAFHPTLAKNLIQWAGPWVQESLKSPAKVLDLCCGTGMASMAALDFFGADTEIHGVDISAASLEIARKKLAIKGADDKKTSFLEGSATQLESLPIEKGAYSLIVCCSALVLLPGRFEDLLREWGSYLKPGGVMVFDIPAVNSQVITDALSHAVKTYGVPTVNRDWIKSQENVSQLINSSGLGSYELFPTDVYKVSELRLDEAETYWGKAVRGLIYDVSGMSSDERGEAKHTFIKSLKGRAKDGIVRDEYKFYVGIAKKA